jgi:parallel beta-helix repeat protein
MPATRYHAVESPSQRGKEDQGMGRGFALKTALLATALTIYIALSAGQALATHVHCGETITQDTTLDSDLIDCPGDGIVIGADDITLDLNGHVIDGAGLYAGVLNPGFGHLTVENGAIRQFATGIDNDGSYSIFRNLTLSNGHFGILFVGARFNRVEKNTIVGGDYGIILDDSSFNSVERNDVLETALFGILLVEASGNVIDRNRVTSTAASWPGIRAIYFDNTYTRNRVSGYTDGILLEESGGVVAHNVVTENTDDGIEIAQHSVEPANAVVLSHNTASYNGDLGIEAETSARVNARSNRAFGNGNPLQCLNVVCK